MFTSISTSKKWLAIYGAVLLASIGLGWAYAAFLEPETRFWAGSFRERREALQESAADQHVLFTGGSVCSFGIDTEVFDALTGRKSFNLGGTRQMGIKIFLGEALKQAKDGDTIVLMCNPHRLGDEKLKRYSKTGAQMAIALSEPIPIGEKLRGTRPGFSHLVTLAAKIAMRTDLFRYHPADRKPGGQVVTLLRDHPPATKIPFEMDSEKQKHAAMMLSHWQGKCAEKGVRLVYLIPMRLTDESVIEESRRSKTEFVNYLREETSVPILPTPLEACSADESLFSDTLFHFTEEGAAWFTREIAPEVRKALDDSGE